jgi:hypothetical protein
VVIGLCLAAAATSVRAEELPEDTMSTPSAPSAAAPPALGGAVGTPQGAPGFKVYIDPGTGRLLKEPAPGSVPLQLSPREQNARSTSQQGLTEVTSPTPGGGVKVDLQGRFRSPLIATIDANGKVRMQHLDETHEIERKK